MDLGSPRSFWKLYEFKFSLLAATTHISFWGFGEKVTSTRRTRQPSSLRIGEMDGSSPVQGGNGKTTTRGVDLLNNNNWCNEAMAMQVAQAKVTEVSHIANK
ncbi:unnamed protein product [Sphagnum balticum]